MTISPIITGCLNEIVLALSPFERWQAVRSFPKSDFMTGSRVILIGSITLVILLVLLLAVSLRRAKQERKSDSQLFAEHARKRGLSIRECQILLKAAQKAGLKQSDSIFTMSRAFDRGTAKMLAEAQADPQAVEEGSQLRMELALLREKLGLKQETLPEDSSAQSVKLSSRQIPIGKQIHITRRKALTAGNIEATIVKNNNEEMGIRLAQPVKIIFGETWCARYYFGSSVWEFDTAVIGYDGEVLVLSHSDNVRFINRRRFLRVPVKLSAFIASFPFEKSLVEDSHNGKDEPADHNSASWGPPVFVPAVVTELAGPGLRVESSLNVKAGDRVLVVFNLEQEQDSISNEGGKQEVITLKIGEAIGDVRHITPLQNGFSIAVELTGLSDSNIDELIRVTNAALLHTGDSNKNMPASEDAAERVPEHTGVSGGQDV